jgi:hypothetical protein
MVKTYGKRILYVSGIVGLVCLQLFFSDAVFPIHMLSTLSFIMLSAMFWYYYPFNMENYVPEIMSEQKLDAWINSVLFYMLFSHIKHALPAPQIVYMICGISLFGVLWSYIKQYIYARSNQ